VSKIRREMENAVTINLGSEQNCCATKLKCAETKSCLHGHPLNELWSCDQAVIKNSIWLWHSRVNALEIMTLSTWLYANSINTWIIV